MKRITILAIGSLGVAVASAAFALPSYAVANVKGSADVGGLPLRVRQAPNTTSKVVKRLKHGETFTIQCRATGPKVSGRHGTSTAWYKIDKGGYVSAVWVKASVSADQVDPCDAKKPAPKPAPKPSQPNKPAPQPSGYQYPFTGTFHLPFKKGAAYPVTQTPFGSFTHNPKHRWAKWNKHAVDFGTPVGTPLYAPGPGKVIKAGWVTTGGGNKVLIDHGNGRCSAMLHLSSISVKAGQQVTTGQLLGKSGNTGNTTGAHLHWGIVNCRTGVSIETPKTYEAGISYKFRSRPVSTNPTR